MSPSSVAIAPAIAALWASDMPPAADRVTAYPIAAPPSRMAIAPAIAGPLATLASELVGLGAARGVAGDADADGVLAGPDRDVLGDRRGAALAPRLELVLARRQALEREPA